MTSTPTPVFGTVQPTNARNDWWQAAAGTPSSVDTRASELSSARALTPVTRFGAIGNVLVGAAMTTSVLAGGGVSGRPADDTLVFTTYQQSIDAPARLGRQPSPDVEKTHAGPSAPLGRAEELKGWLGLADEDLASIIGVSRRTLSNWRNGDGSYASSSARVSTVHALVARLIDTLGDASLVRLWLSIEVQPGMTRMESLAEGQAGISRVLEAGSGLFFVSPRRSLFESDLTDAQAATVAAGARSDDVPAASAARRVRRPGVIGRS